MTRKPERRPEASTESSISFYVFTPFLLWRRHVVMLQVGEQAPMPFARFWSCDNADAFAERFNALARGNHKGRLFGRLR